MSDPRIANDIHPELIIMWRALQKGWIPPSLVSEEDYVKAKAGEGFPFLRGFIGFGCSFGGKWFGGYARDSQERNYALQSKNSVLKQIASMGK